MHAHQHTLAQAIGPRRSPSHHFAWPWVKQHYVICDSYNVIPGAELLHLVFCSHH